MTFIQRIQNNPALLSGFLIAGLSLFISDVEQVGKLSTLISAGVPLALAFFVRSQVSGPLTSERLAKAVVDPPASKKAKKDAEEILE